MRTLNLNKYGVAELNAREMWKTDGGAIASWILRLFFCRSLGDATLPPPDFTPEYNIQDINTLLALDGINNWGEGGEVIQ